MYKLNCRKIFAHLLSVAVMLSSFCVFSASDAHAEEASDYTYFWGFDDNAMPGGFSTKNIESAFNEGIFNINALNADPLIMVNQSFQAEDYNLIKIRMKHDVEESETRIPMIQIFFSVKNADGTSSALSQTNSFKYANLPYSSDDKFITYTIALTGKSAYAGTISYLRIDPVDLPGSVDIDYIMLTRTDDKTQEWEFDSSSDLNVWKHITGKGSTAVAEDGVVKCNVDSNCNLKFTYTPNEEIKTSEYDYLEVIMKHDIETYSTSTSSARNTMRLYLSGYTYDNSGARVDFAMNENNKLRIILDEKSGESFYRYKFPLSGKLIGGLNIDNAYITSLRLDPIADSGICEIDTIRLVSKRIIYTPLDRNELNLTYEFANAERGSAKGTVKIDFGTQSSFNAKSVELSWASYSDENGYAPLADYRSIKQLTGDEAERGYVISKDMYIPEEATAVIADITDCDGSFRLAYDIPSGKRSVAETPIYKIGLISDIHFGDDRSLYSYNSNQIAAYEFLNNSDVDVIAVAGDITQWYGAYSKGQLYYDWQGTEYDVENDVSQWDLAYSYFKQFDVPVYIVEGNHDTPEGKFTAEKTNGATTPQYMKDFLTSWINYSVENGFYEDSIEREKVLYNGEYEDATFYHDYIDGYHFIFVRIPHCGRYTMTEQEYKWLDRVLYENESTGEPTFVFTHAPYENTVEGNSKYIFSDENFNRIINKHPNTIVVSGHTHYALDTDFPSTINGKMENPSYVHDGGIQSVYYSAGSSTKNEAQLVILEIYKDRIVTRGRELLSGKWIPRGINEITLKSLPQIGRIDVSAEAAGNTYILTADSGDDDVIYTWCLDGDVLESGQSIAINSDYDGFLAVRAQDLAGNIRSASFESLEELLNANNTPVITVTDGADNGIITKDTVTVNADNAKPGAKLICAQYDDSGKLIKTDSGTVEKINFNRLSFNVDNNTSNVKIMLWDDLEACAPLCGALSLAMLD